MTEDQLLALERALLNPPREPKPIIISPADDPTCKRVPSHDELLDRTAEVRSKWDEVEYQRRSKWANPESVETQEVTMGFEESPLSGW